MNEIAQAAPSHSPSPCNAGQIHRETFALRLEESNTARPDPLRMPVVHIIDANVPWVRALVAALPPEWKVLHYRIYNPLWLPRGFHDLPRLNHWHRLDDRTEEIYLATPGWRRFESLSAAILNLHLPRRKNNPAESVFLFTFPFYSAVAARLRRSLPDATIAYWAHDAFAYYDFAPGYIRHHEDLLVPLCDARFAMAPMLVKDYAERYSDHPFELLHDAVSRSFLGFKQPTVPRELEAIRQRGGPLVGCIGQINGAYDWDLLEAAAAANPATQFVFIGNLFEEGEITNRIRRYFELANVHWLGRVDHERLPDYLRGFDLCLNPLAVSDHNHRRDPLRIYDYLTTEAPIVSTDLDGVRMHRDFVEIIPDRAEFISRLSHTPDRLPESQLEARRNYISGNTWEERALEFVAKIESLPEHSRGALK